MTADPPARRREGLASGHLGYVVSFVQPLDLIHVPMVQDTDHTVIVLDLDRMPVRLNDCAGAGVLCTLDCPIVMHAVADAQLRSLLMVHCPLRFKQPALPECVSGV